MGKRGATINRIRSNSAATIKVIQPERGLPVVPCAVDDDELILVSPACCCCCCCWSGCSAALGRVLCCSGQGAVLSAHHSQQQPASHVAWISGRLLSVHQSHAVQDHAPTRKDLRLFDMRSAS
jgi:hypothetical protein